MRTIFLHNSDITFDFTNRDKVIVHQQNGEPWKVTVVDTGLNTMTGGRVKRISKYLNNEPFMLTYGDGVSNVDLIHLLDFHKQHKKLVTMTSIQPEGRFGVLDIDSDDLIKAFREKSKEDSGWINGGFMVINPEFINYIDGDETVLEQEPMHRAVKENQLVAYKHHGYWQNMDTLRDKQKLESLWESNKAPWKVWE